MVAARTCSCTTPTSTAPTSWDVVWNSGADGTGKVSVYDSSIYIADAALHLKQTQPDLGIDNPYQLTQPQFDAAIALLEQQRDAGALYWGTYADPIASYTAGDVTMGTSWQFQTNLLQSEDRPSPRSCPTRRVDGMVGHLDDRQEREASQLHVHVDGPHGVRGGERPGHGLVRRGSHESAGMRLRRTIAAGHALTHATDEAYYDKVEYWSTPQADCADDDDATTCRTRTTGSRPGPAPRGT